VCYGLAQLVDRSFVEIVCCCALCAIFTEQPVCELCRKALITRNLNPISNNTGRNGSAVFLSVAGQISQQFCMLLVKIFLGHCANRRFLTIAPCFGDASSIIVCGIDDQCLSHPRDCGLLQGTIGHSREGAIDELFNRFRRRRNVLLVTSASKRDDGLSVDVNYSRERARYMSCAPSPNI
jgi:hypothetical protein